MEFEYKIPNEIKEKLTDDFYNEFIRQLKLIFSYNNFEPKTYNNFYSYVESTGGWNQALKATCVICRLESIYFYWNALEWYESDLFDDELAMLMCEKGFYDLGEDIFVDKN